MDWRRACESTVCPARLAAASPFNWPKTGFEAGCGLFPGNAGLETSHRIQPIRNRRRQHVVWGSRSSNYGFTNTIVVSGIETSIFEPG